MNGILNDQAVDEMIKRGTSAKVKARFRRKPYESIAECQERMKKEIFKGSSFRSVARGEEMEGSGLGKFHH